MNSTSATVMFGISTIISGFIMWMTTDIKTDIRETRRDVKTHIQEAQATFEKIRDDQKEADHKRNLHVQNPDLHYNIATELNWIKEHGLPPRGVTTN